MSDPKFLTTREAADLLRVKERKIYELAGRGEIPVSRAAGKLLFPREMLEMWVRSHVDYTGAGMDAANRPIVVAGSHDPLLDWALRESGCAIATFFDGSLDGLARLVDGQAIAAGIHIFDPASGRWNGPALAAAAPGLPLVAVEWARRRQGLVLPAGNPAGVEHIADLAGKRVIPRQSNAGARILFDALLAEAGLDPADIDWVDPPARSETDVAFAVSAGKADAGFAIESGATQLRLGFVPLVEERFDLAVWRRDFFEAPLQSLLAFCRTGAFEHRADELGGYDLSGHGTVHHNGP